MGNVREPGDSSTGYNAAIGRQGYITGGGTVATFDAAAQLKDAGQLAPGTYKYQIPTSGAMKVDVTLGWSAMSATKPAAKIYPTGADDQSQKAGTAAVDFDFSVANPQTKRFDDLCGEHYVVVEISIAAANPATPNAGEYSAL